MDIVSFILFVGLILFLVGMIFELVGSMVEMGLYLVLIFVTLALIFYFSKYLEISGVIRVIQMLFDFVVSAFK